MNGLEISLVSLGRFSQIFLKEMMSHIDSVKSYRVFKALVGMRKIDTAGLKMANEG